MPPIRSPAPANDGERWQTPRKKQETASKTPPACERAIETQAVGGCRVERTVEGGGGCVCARARVN